MKSNDKKIAVIGAGPMGLAVAYQLVKEGYAPVVFEADDRIGGMSAAFDFGGISIERYYHFICTNDFATLQILDELGLRNRLHWKSTKMGFYVQGKIHAWGSLRALLRFPHLDLISKVRYALHVLYSIMNKSWERLDRISAIEWIRHSIGEKAYDVLWKKLFDYKFYHFSNRISAAWIWCRIHRIGHSRQNFKERSGYLEGGSVTLMNAMRDYIEKNGGVVKTSQGVNKILTEDGKVTGLVVENQRLDFDRVISTVPLPLISKIIPDYPEHYLNQYRQIENIAVVCVIAKLKKSVSTNFWLNVNDPEMELPGLVEYTNLNPLSGHIVYVPFYMPFEQPAYRDADRIFVDKVKSYLQKINPDISSKDIVDVRVNRYRYAQPICTPGFLKKLPPMDGVVSGLMMADTSYYYPEDRGISESVRFGRELARKMVRS